jgi:6-phosphogluconolactonase
MVVLLGMGADGHFASLFPGAANLPKAGDAGLRHRRHRHPARSVAAGSPLRADQPDPAAPAACARDACWSSPARTSGLCCGTRNTMRHPFPVAALLHAPGPHVHIHWSP